MITFKKLETKKYEIFKDDEKIHDLNLITSTVTNKYYIITDFVENMSKTLGEEFDEWFSNFICGYHKLYIQPKKQLSEETFESEDCYTFVVKNVPKLKEYVDKYIKSLDIDFTRYVNMSKVKKGSILFEPEEIESIIKISGYLKLYSFISNSEEKFGRRLETKIYNLLVDELTTKEIISKIYNVVKAKTYRYNLTDKYMWDYLKLMQSKSIDSYVIEIFNFIMNSIIVLCEETKNPITYFVGVVDESVKWFLRSVYKGSITYDDSIATEDIHGMNVDNLMTYAYNDTLGRLKDIAYNKLQTDIADIASKQLVKDSEHLEDKMITAVHERLKTIEYVAPIAECMVFPILSQALSIPYNHFKTINAEHSMVLSYYIKSLVKDIFHEEYSEMIKLMEYYPTNPPLIATTYKPKRAEILVNTTASYKNFFGFQSCITPYYNIIGHYIGKISSRCKLVNIITNEVMTSLPVKKLETEIINFFIRYFAGDFQDEINVISNLISAEF